MEERQNIGKKGIYSMIRLGGVIYNDRIFPCVFAAKCLEEKGRRNTGKDTRVL